MRVLKGLSAVSQGAFVSRPLKHPRRVVLRPEPSPLWSAGVPAGNRPPGRYAFSLEWPKTMEYTAWSGPAVAHWRQVKVLDAVLYL